MFENLLKFWKGKDFLTQVYADFKEMLVDSRDMFDSVCRKLIRGEDEPALKSKIYDVDKKINELEKNIRLRVIEHLALQPTVDVSCCLLLMSVVKDAERLGDYCKNLFEVTQLLEKPIDQEKYKKWFNNLDANILNLFDETKLAFIESDDTKARQSWEQETGIVKKCDEIIEKASKSDLSVNEAVCFTLIARYYKRLTAHLTNIATSVILPISELDYFDEKRKSKIKGEDQA